LQKPISNISLTSSVLFIGGVIKLLFDGSIKLEYKRCSKCKEIKSVNEFFKDKRSKNGYQSHCKKCLKEYYKNNVDKRKLYWKEYCKNNIEKIKKYHREYCKNNARKIIEYIKTRIRTDPKFRLNRKISKAIWRSIRQNKNGKYWEKIVDFTLKDLRIHLEKQFKPGMTWNNYGKWHIDHKKPFASFNFSSYEDPEFKKCWALENLQPLWAEENFSKGNKILTIKIL